MTMSNDFPCLSPAGGFLRESQLRPFGRLPAKETITPDDPAQTYWDKILTIERCVADTLFEVGDSLSLDAALEALLEDPSYQRLQRELRAMTTFEMVERAATEFLSPPPRLVAGAGKGLMHRVRRANQLMNAAGSAVLQILAWLARKHVSCGEEEDAELRQAAPQTTDNLAFLSDPDMSPAVKEILLKREIADACMFGIGAANDRGVASWMKETLVNRWIEGLEGYLLLLALHSDVDVPEELAPRDKREELLSTLQKHFVAKVGYESQLEQARASGSDLFPPLAAGDG